MEERKFEILSGDQINNLDKDWPVTYILRSKDGKKIYIGITTNFKRRMNQHASDERKKDLTEKIVISNTHANQSITYYLESFLIHHGRMNDNLKSINTKIQDGELYKENNFYEKEVAEDEAKIIYEKLHEMKVFNNTIEELKDNIFSHYHPDWSFTIEQNKIIDESIELINNNKTFYVQGAPGTGKTAILLKLVNDYHLHNSTNKNKTLGVYSASKQNRNVIKKYISLIMNEYNVMFFETLTEVKKHLNNNIDLHLLVDEAQSLDGASYGTGIHIKSGYKSELEWIENNIKYFTLFFDPLQTDYGRDIKILDELKRENQLLELKDQFRIDADKRIFELFKEMIGIDGEYKDKYEKGSFNIQFVDSVNEGIQKIIELNNNEKNKIHRALNPNYNRAEYRRWFNEGCPFFESYKEYDLAFKASRSKDVLKDSRIEMLLNSKRVKGMSLDSSFVWIGDEVDYVNGEIVIDYNKWSKNVLQDRTEEEKINIIKNTYLILLSRSRENLIIYTSSESLSEYLKSIVNNKI